jgi:hypothetical protein
MADEKSKPIDVDKLLQNKLKGISIGTLELELAKVVSDLVGEDYKCNINDVKYSMFSGADFHVKIEMTYNPDKE